MNSYNAVVIGAGLSGAVVAERLASAGKRVLVIEQRSHLAGNCYDWRNGDGTLIHQYGPHIFHTDRQDVWEYLSQYTDWFPYQHRVLGHVDGTLIPLPFNLDSLYRLFPTVMAKELESLLVEHYGFGARVPILQLRQSDSAKLHVLADYIYTKVFANYSRKQWGIEPENLDPTVTGRIPVLVSRDDRYFQDPWQAIPRNGYTGMVESILNHPNINLMLNTSMNDVLRINLETGDKQLFGTQYHGDVVYTGMIDALFDYCDGKLPYRSLRFEWEQVGSDRRQPAAVINYPNEYDFTRITDLAHFIGRTTGKSTLMKEYPCAYTGNPDDGMPYYPVFTESNYSLFDKYHKAAKNIPGLYMLGRLAQYKYYDMDDAVAAALELAANIVLMNDD